MRVHVNFPENSDRKEFPITKSFPSAEIHPDCSEESAASVYPNSTTNIGGDNGEAS